MTLLDETPPLVGGETQLELEGLVRVATCRALEHEFEVFAPPDQRALDEIGNVVRPFRVATGSTTSARRYVLSPAGDDNLSMLSCDGLRIAGGRLGRRDFSGPLAWHINRSVIDSSVDRFWLMHAAAVTKAGHTIVMPADQESGKTTTTAGLLRCDFDYVTDEAVAIDPETLWVRPFPKALSLDRGSWPLFPELTERHYRPGAQQWHVPAADLGARSEQRDVAPPVVVAIPQYVGGPDTTVQRLEPAAAAFELARMTFHFGKAPRRNLAAIRRLVERATIVRLRIGTLDGATDAVEELLSQRILDEV